MNMQYVILGLTAMVLIIGGFLVFETSREQQVMYADGAAYEEARKTGALPHSAPLVPVCANDIIVVASETLIEEVSFTCDDALLREAYASEIEAQFEWNYFEYANGAVTVRRAE